MRNSLKRMMVSSTLAIVMLATLCPPATAHNKLVHKLMTRSAFVLIEDMALNPGHYKNKPANVTQEQWNDLLSAAKAALPKLTKLAGTFPDATEGGFEKDNGMRLGEAAARVDDEIDDVHVWFRPTSAGEFGALKKFADEGVKLGVTALLVPFVCIGGCIGQFFGFSSDTCDDCVKNAKKLGAKAPKPSDLEGLIPGVGDFPGDSVEGLTGAWHFINMTPSLSNDFDDRQGLYYLEAGVNKEPGTVDLAILIASTYTGLSVRYDTSNGPARYQVEAASDGHENTDPMRGKAQWQAYPLGLTVFEPVDNLGFFGWHKFHDEKQAATFLAWPLHALGDATVPMHVAGTTAWGHRPFENAQERLWPLIGRRMGINTIAPGTASVTAFGSSDPELGNVLARAVAWRQQVLQWRSKGHGKDVPVRDLITNLAQRTYNYSMTRQDQLGDWPFRDWPSTEYFLGAKETAEDFYREYPDAVTKVLPLMEDGVAAKTAFLLSAMEEVQP